MLPVPEKDPDNFEEINIIINEGNKIFNILPLSNHSSPKKYEKF